MNVLTKKECIMEKKTNNRDTGEKRRANPVQTVNEKKEWISPELVELGVKGTRSDIGHESDASAGFDGS